MKNQNFTISSNIYIIKKQNNIIPKKQYNNIILLLCIYGIK